MKKKKNHIIKASPLEFEGYTWFTLYVKFIILSSDFMLKNIIKNLLTIKLAVNIIQSNSFIDIMII